MSLNIKLIIEIRKESCENIIKFLSYYNIYIAIYKNQDIRKTFKLLFRIFN